MGSDGLAVGVTGKIMKIEKSKVEILHDLQDSITAFAQSEQTFIAGTATGSIHVI